MNRRLIELPVYNCFVEDILNKLICNSGNEYILDRREVGGAGIVLVSGER
jgi:hypothetical protein